MGLANKFGSQQSSTTTTPARGGNRNGGNRNRPNHPRRGGGGGGGGGGNGNSPFGDDASTAYALADPQAFFRDLLTQAGFAPTDNTGFANFLNTTLASGFEDQWKQYQSNPLNTKKTIHDFLRERYPAVPEAYLTAKPGQPAMPMDWTAFQQAILGEANRYSPSQTGRFDSGKQPSSIRWNLFQ